MSRHQHPLTSVAALASPSASNTGAGAAADARNTLTYDQLEPGTGFPTGQLAGRLKLLYKDKSDERESDLKLDFAIKVKLATSPASADYVQSKQQRRTIMARFVLLPSPSDSPADVASVLAGNAALLRRSLGSTLAVDCAGAKVASRRTMGDGTTEVMFRATGSRAVTIDGTAHQFLSMSIDLPPLTRRVPKSA